MGKRISVTAQSRSGRNQRFKDNSRKRSMTRNTFVQKIEKGQYPNYHIRKINGIKTPVSNPDKSTNNNLG